MAGAGRSRAEAKHHNVLIDFLGATQTVTGSRFLVTTPRARILVDCGLYQGLKPLRLRNWEPLPAVLDDIDCVLLTHAHVDHSGFLPRLARLGFNGPIFCTQRTHELCGIVLPDSGYLHEEEAAYANAGGFSKHSPAMPLFTKQDAVDTLEQFVPVPYGERIEVAEGVHVFFRPAGHILGSATIALHADGLEEAAVVFSGDLGRPSHPFLLPPVEPVAARTVVIESTYGDEEHCEESPEQRLGEAISRAVERGGVVVIPAFAVDRTEVVLYHVKRLMEQGAIPELPVYADSPMALASLRVYRDAIEAGDSEIRPGLHEVADLFEPKRLVEARAVDASKAIHDVDGPALIISASGMGTGGRVVHHLARRLPDARNSIIFVGYQAAGTRGRSLIEGAKQVKLLGRHIPVRAEIVDLSAFSVHADRSELLDWLGAMPREPEAVYVVHGEPEASSALCEAIADRLGWCAAVPRYGERVVAASLG